MSHNIMPHNITPHKISSTETTSVSTRTLMAKLFQSILSLTHQTKIFVFVLVGSQVNVVDESAVHTLMHMQTAMGKVAMMTIIHRIFSKMPQQPKSPSYRSWDSILFLGSETPIIIFQGSQTNQSLSFQYLKHTNNISRI